jgi:hypothetical protein
MVSSALTPAPPPPSTSTCPSPSRSYRPLSPCSSLSRAFWSTCKVPHFPERCPQCEATVRICHINFDNEAVFMCSNTEVSWEKGFCRSCHQVVYQSIYFETVRTHTTQKNIYSCGLNVLLGRSGQSTVEIMCFFIMSGLKYHNLYKCIKAQICLRCKLLQNAAIFFLFFVSLCSDLMASGNPFQTVAMAARRVPGTSVVVGAPSQCF